MQGCSQEPSIPLFYDSTGPPSEASFEVDTQLPDLFDTHICDQRRFVSIVILALNETENLPHGR